MQTNKNSQWIQSPVIGNMYKLWSLPTGSVVKRDNFKIGGVEVKSFKIVEQIGATACCETHWGEMFHLDASLEASLIKFN